MFSKSVLSGLLLAASLGSPASTGPIEERQVYALGGIGFDEPTQTLGNAYNYWVKYPNGTFDLTRSDIMSVTKPKVIPFSGQRTSAIIEPSRSVLCIVDMQNFFLHPELSPKATLGRAAVEPTVNMINAFRHHGMKVTWVNWGLTNYDLLTIPPVLKSQFSTDDYANSTFGSDMGTIEQNGTTIAVGPKLMRGAWNAEPYGILGEMKDAGVAAGTDLVFHKNRLSGLWGPQTPFGLWLQENEITTIFFGGVNADQCVWGTFIDAYFKGYDVVYVDDIAATTSPVYASEMVRYNANSDGFIGNSTDIIKGLGC
ncbi:Isochorismatase hydrolase [Pleurostoma richardsiae]|uniref:Isochorismatase hydrolase n=1 Tax=Pleurostoma richardsiae TaxID=41990 RepID=A0AA38RK31_9PEZI|nr:Isochorismatase hydrolase [Pleurostoma richardsiae]